MSNLEDKTVGYVAVHPSMTMYCEDESCIVVSTQSALNKLLKSAFDDVSVFEKRKAKFHEVIEGMEMGGAYAFDKQSCKIFKHIAKTQNVTLVENIKSSSNEGREFAHISIEKL
ncbi:MAG: hypothetical protein ACI9Y1_003434 [Lentisphaeria bacterium]|jgi:hypothetical protein